MKFKVSVIFVILMVFGNYVYASSNKVSDKKALGIAKEYILDVSTGDENWKKNNPTIIEEGKYFYTNESTPSYIEFKVSCDMNKDCGFIIVNLDKNDVSIPIASTLGGTPSETLIQGEKSEYKNKKFYYFSPFEQYLEDTVSGDVVSILSEDNEVLIGGEDSQDKNELTRKINLQKKLEKAIEDSEKFKKSKSFKTIKQELIDTKEISSDDELSMKILPFATAAGTQIIGTGTYVTGSSTTNCNSRIPCYQQYSYAYSGGNCKSGCAPTAVGMLFGYHDRVGNYPNLLTGVATDYIINSATNTNVTTLINSVRNNMQTYCDSSGGGATLPSKIGLAYQYAVGKGYANSMGYYATGTPAWLLSIIKTEINKGNPIIISTLTHALVVYGYNNTSNSQMVRVNYGWGNGAYSNADVNVNSINVNGSSYAITSTTRFNIQ